MIIFPLVPGRSKVPTKHVLELFMVIHHSVDHMAASKTLDYSDSNLNQTDKAYIMHCTYAGCMLLTSIL